jgi:hypothetical protein
VAVAGVDLALLRGLHFGRDRRRRGRGRQSLPRQRPRNTPAHDPLGIGRSTSSRRATARRSAEPVRQTVYRRPIPATRPRVPHGLQHRSSAVIARSFETRAIDVR